MKIAPDQMKLRLEAALRTLERLTLDRLLTEDCHVALTRAEWHIAATLAALAETEQR